MKINSIIEKCLMNTLKQTIFKWKNYLQKHLLLNLVNIIPLKKLYRSKTVHKKNIIYSQDIHYKLAMCRLHIFFFNLANFLRVLFSCFFFPQIFIILRFFFLHILEKLLFYTVRNFKNSTKNFINF